MPSGHMAEESIREKSKEIQSIRKHIYILDSILEEENGSYTFLDQASENYADWSNLW